MKRSHLKWYGALGLPFILVTVVSIIHSPILKAQWLLFNKTCPRCHLRNIELKTFDLRDADLQHANFSGAQMQFVVLDGANLSAWMV